MACTVSLSGSMVIRMGVKLGRDLILSVENRTRQWPRRRRRRRHPRFGAFTDLVHHFHHLLQLLGADVRTVGEPEVDEDPLAQEVLAPPGFVVVVDEGERAPQRRPSYRLGPFFFNHWELFGHVIKKVRIPITSDSILTCFLLLLEVFHGAEQGPAHRKRCCQGFPGHRL